jgi:hypothetical protein
MLRNLPLTGTLLLALAACGGDTAPQQARRAIDTVAGSAAAPAPVQDSAVAFRDQTATVHRARPGMRTALLRTIQANAHTDYDRVVLEFTADSAPGYHVAYADTPARECGSGDVVQVAGEAQLLVRIEPARAHTEDGTPTAVARHATPGLTVVREMKLICDFEGQVEWVLGLAAPHPYRVLEPSGAARLVIDVRHDD